MHGVATVLAAKMFVKALCFARCSNCFGYQNVCQGFVLCTKALREEKKTVADIYIYIILFFGEHVFCGKDICPQL